MWLGCQVGWQLRAADGASRRFKTTSTLRLTYPPTRLELHNDNSAHLAGADVEAAQLRVNGGVALGGHTADLVAYQTVGQG